MTTCEVVIIRDADLEYNPKEYPLLSGAAEFAAVTYRAIRDRNELKTRIDEQALADTVEGLTRLA